MKAQRTNAAPRVPHETKQDWKSEMDFQRLLDKHRVQYVWLKDQRDALCGIFKVAKRKKRPDFIVFVGPKENADGGVVAIDAKSRFNKRLPDEPRLWIEVDDAAKLIEFERATGVHTWVAFCSAPEVWWFIDTYWIEKLADEGELEEDVEVLRYQPQKKKRVPVYRIAKRHCVCGSEMTGENKLSDRLNAFSRYTLQRREAE